MAAVSGGRAARRVIGGAAPLSPPRRGDSTPRCVPPPPAPPPAGRGRAERRRPGSAGRLRVAMNLHQVLTGAVNPGDNCFSVGSLHGQPFTVSPAAECGGVGTFPGAPAGQPGWGRPPSASRAGAPHVKMGVALVALVAVVVAAVVAVAASLLHKRRPSGATFAVGAPRRRPGGPRIAPCQPCLSPRPPSFPSCFGFSACAGGALPAPFPSKMPPRLPLLSRRK